MRWLPTLLFAVITSAAGGYFSGIPDVAAGRPFSYVPPPGFSPITIPANVNADGAVDRVWVEPSEISHLDPRVSLFHLPHASRIDDASLAEIARGMPALYEKSHGSWTEERHVVHVRPDGARVGLVVGNLTTADGSHMRTMQMLFPDDSGSSIATASFDVVSAPRLAPEFEKSIDAADGVKKLGKSAENWLYVACGLGGAVVAIALQLLASRRAKT